MRNFLSFLIVCFFLVSCNNTNTFKITGTIPVDKLDGKTMYMMSAKEWQRVDSVVIEKGTFEFEREAGDSTVLYILTVFDIPMKSPAFFSEKGIIKVEYDSTLEVATVSGTPLNDAFGKYESEREALYTEMRENFEKKKKLKGFYSFRFIISAP